MPCSPTSIVFGMRSAVTDLAPVFELHDAWVRLGATDVLKGVDFTLRRGEFVVLLGPNGSGKSTLVKTMLGAVPLSAGIRFIFGKTPDRFKRWDRVGYVPQRSTAASGVPATVDEVVLSGRAAKVGMLGRYGAQDRAEVARALEVVDLTRLMTSRVEALSGGQQQRVLIARALVTDPAVLVMDEPVASVDLAHQESLAATLERLNAAGTSILLVAHSLGAMERLVRRALVLEGGLVVHDGSPGEAVLVGHPHPHHPETRRGS
jgi:zinc transport system ATP-binding protein